jgi:hypothetical protein
VTAPSSSCAIWYADDRLRVVALGAASSLDVVVEGAHVDSSTTPAGSPPALPEPDLLERIVTLVDAALVPHGWYHPHVLIKIEATGDPASFDLGLKDLPADVHPVDELWGFVAPDSWLAIGVVTYGWASPMGGMRPSQHPERRRVRATILVDRSGRQVASATMDDGTCIDEPGEGLIGDVLLRCIGASTAPPPPLEEFCERLWLLRVADESEHRPLGWKRVEQMQVPPDSTWNRLRRMGERSGRWMVPEGWIDDGLFARHVLASLPSVDELLARLDAQLSVTTARKVRAAVEAARVDRTQPG